jgi:uncharacterized membrane protein YeaQ/YmgE (transglycosylase-associated protein family)
MIFAILVGTIAGFLAGKIMNGSGYGLFMDLILGVVGGLFGGIVLSLVGIRASGFIGAILVATFGSVMLIYLVRWLRSSRSSY